MIVLTGYYDREVRREAYKIGAMAFLSKPTPFTILIKVVRLIVEHGLHFVGPVEADTWKKEEFQWAL